MKHFILVLALISCTAFLQGQDWAYSNTLSGVGDITTLNSVIDDAGNILTYGYFTGEILASSGETLQAIGEQDYFIAKFDPQGGVLWLKSVGSRLDDWFTGGIGTDSDNNVFITGGFQSYLLYTETDSIQSSNAYDTFLAKYDASGNALWCLNTGSGGALQVPTSLYVDNDNNILLGGWFIGSIAFDGSNSLVQENAYKDYYFAKFDSGDGAYVWANHLKSINSNFSGFIYSFLHEGDSYYIGGVYADSVQVESDTVVALGTNKYDIHLMKSNTSGDIEWIRKIRGADHDYAFSIVADGESNIYLSGYHWSDSLVIDSTETINYFIKGSFGNYDFLILKYDPNGNLKWKKPNGGPGDDRILDAEFFDGHAVCCRLFC